MKARTVIDPAVLRELQDIIGGSRADLVDLISGFLDDAPEQLTAMTAAAAAADFETVRRAAHSLKSNGRDLGALGFAKLCAELESDLSASAPLGSPIERVEQIIAIWPQVRGALMAEISRNGAET